jgi:D-glycero-alpha-D-manno-heptose-7-phosphate kinase
VGGHSSLRRVRAIAPIRICDIGGWTDTWFAAHGRVFNIAVTPSVEVEISLRPRSALDDPVTVHLMDADGSYSLSPEALPRDSPLIGATIEELGVPHDVSAEISVSSGVPPGSSTGTSAAVSVALIAALDALTAGRMTRREIAITAHRIEVERLGLQSGVQDQLCAAYGGVNYIEISAYPEATVTQIPLSDEARQELEGRLELVLLGRTHVSSDVHERVIDALAGEGPDAPLLVALRQAADDARDAARAADFAALGRAMTANTELQRQLHPDLISAEAQTVMETAAGLGAWGWKVNGAGGDGGSVTILTGPDRAGGSRLGRALVEAEPSLRLVPTTLSRDGVRVREE